MTHPTGDALNAFNEFEHVQTGDLNNDFRTCLSQLMEHGLVTNPRGSETKEFLNYNITLRDPRNRIINFPDRKTSLKYLLGELVWYFSGSNDPAGILPYSKFWDMIRNSGDMPGYDAGTINSNYGYRLFGHDNDSLVPSVETAMTPHGIDESGKVVIEPHETSYVAGTSQWNAVVDILKKDKDSRQAIINIHLPQDRHVGNKDVPCTLTFHFLIRENKLHLIINMRSNDIVRGFTNDVFQFTMLQECMMMQLRETYPELELGTYFHNAGSMHIYDLHYGMANKIIADHRSLEMAMIPMDAFNDEVLLGITSTEQTWRNAGCPKDMKLEHLECWHLMTPYWQNLFRMCFLEDEEAMHDVFGIDHDHG